MSWNFKHIVRVDRMRAFDTVNVVEGQVPLSIVAQALILDLAGAWLTKAVDFVIE